MSELEKQITNRVANNADLEGAQDLIDAHIDAVTGGYFVPGLHVDFIIIVVPPPHPGPVYNTNQ